MKATYTRQPDGQLVAAGDPMPVTGDPVETPFGILNGDVFLRKKGADLCVLGTLRRSRKIRETTVSLSCGDFQHAIQIRALRMSLAQDVTLCELAEALAHLSFHII